MTQMVKNLPAREARVGSLGQEVPLEKGMATNSSILAWRILWTEGGMFIHNLPIQKFSSECCIVNYIWPTLVFQFSSVQSLNQSCSTHCNPMDCGMPGFPVHHQLLELAQTHVQWVGDAIQPPHPLLSPSSLAFNLSQHQGLFHWVSSLHQVAKVLEFQLQHQSFQWIFRTDFL